MPGREADEAEPNGEPHSKASSDAELLDGIKRADHAAFNRLVELHFAAVYRVAWRMLGGKEGAEDVAQEAFLRLWRNPGQVRDGQALKSWLMRVASNLVLDRYRRRAPEAHAEVPDVADAAPGPELSLRRAQIAAQIDAAIAALPERQRLALVLCHYEGFGNPEIAAALDVSVEAVESLLARARRALKGLLAGRWRELLDDLGSL